MSKHLPFELAKHHLLIQAFKGEDGRFTTENVYADDPKGYLWCGVEVQNRKEVETELSCELTNHLQIAIHDSVKITAPAADLEELLKVGRNLIISIKPSKLTLRESDLLDIMKGVWGNPEDLECLAKAIIEVLEERK